MGYVLPIPLILCWELAAPSAAPSDGSLRVTYIFAPLSTPAEAVYEASLLVLAICASSFSGRRWSPGLHHYPLPASSCGYQPGAAAGLRQQPDRTRLDGGADPDRLCPRTGHRTYDCRHTKCHTAC